MPTAVNRTMSPQEWGLLLTLSLIWGSSFLWVGLALHALPPLTIVLCRVGLAAATLWAVLVVLREPLAPLLAAWRPLLIMGLLNNAIPFFLIAWGQVHIASGLASILNATTPFFAVVVADRLTHDERMTPLRLLGVLVGLVGGVVMIGAAALESFSADVLGQLAIIGAALCYAVSSVFGWRFRGLGLSPLATATGQVTASSLLLLPAVALVDRPWTLPMPGTGVTLAVVTLAVVATALAYILYFRILSTAGATNLMLVTFLVPVGAILWGTLFLDERLEPNHFAGMACIALGLAAIDGRPLRWLHGLLPAGRRERPQ